MANNRRPLEWIPYPEVECDWEDIIAKLSQNSTDGDALSGGKIDNSHQLKDTDELDVVASDGAERIRTISAPFGRNSFWISTYMGQDGNHGNAQVSLASGGSDLQYMISSSIPAHKLKLLSPLHLRVVSSSPADIDTVITAPSNFWPELHGVPFESKVIAMLDDDDSEELDVANLDQVLENKLEITASPDASTVLGKGSPRIPVYSLDVSSTDFGISGSTSGSVRIWNAQTGKIKRMLSSSGHIGDVRLVKWFPSELIALTAAADRKIKLWTIETGACVLTLEGHERSVSGVAMIGRGRTFATCSLDGSARLWDCSKGQSIRAMGAVDQDKPLNACLLLENYNDGNPTATGSEQTESDVLVCAGEPGELTGFDFRSDKPAFVEGVSTSAINTLAKIPQGPDSLLFAGCQSGTIFSLDLRMLDKRLHDVELAHAANLKAAARSFATGEYSITNLGSSSKGDGLWVATEKGDCLLLKVDTKNISSCSVSCIQSLCGVDVEPVYSMCVKQTASGDHLQEMVWTASKDGVRKYEVHV